MFFFLSVVFLARLRPGARFFSSQWRLRHSGMDGALLTFVGWP